MLLFCCNNHYECSFNKNLIWIGTKSIGGCEDNYGDEDIISNVFGRSCSFSDNKIYWHLYHVKLYQW